MNTSGNQWNTTLRGSPWDYVVLQDQSQVPSFPSTNSMWQDSKNASVSLSGAIADEGETCAVHDLGLSQRGQPEQLQQQFHRHAGSIDGRVHPIRREHLLCRSCRLDRRRPAFKTVHDGVVADGDDPTGFWQPLLRSLHLGRKPSVAVWLLPCCLCLPCRHHRPRLARAAATPST